MHLVILGSPGAGKGTQSQLISEKYGIPQISTGDILRNAIQQNSPLGKKVKEVVESGSLVPDEIMIELVKDRLKKPDCLQGFLLDGFPRTVNQAKALANITPIDFVIDIDVPEEEVIKRLSGRRIHEPSGRVYHILYNPPKVSGQDDMTGEALVERADDKEESLRKRLALYQNQTTPLREYYKNVGGTLKYVKIDGTDAVGTIKDKIFSLLSQQSEGALK